MLIKSLIPAELNSVWKVVAICESRSECQVDNFLSNVGANLLKSAKGMRQLFAMIAINGPQNLPTDISHRIADGVWQFTKGRLRVAWFYDGEKVVVCCQAALKKTQKAPRPFIDAAVACMQEYKIQKARGNVTELPGEE